MERNATMGKTEERENRALHAVATSSLSRSKSYVSRLHRLVDRANALHSFRVNIVGSGGKGESEKLDANAVNRCRIARLDVGRWSMVDGRWSMVDGLLDGKIWRSRRCDIPC